MKIHIGLLMVGLFAAASPAALAEFDLEGYWQRSDVGENEKAPGIAFLRVGDQYLGSTEVSYVDARGVPTGEKIEYFYSFDAQEKNSSLFGKLETFDQHYSCFLENGPSVVEVAGGSNEIVLSFPKIFFTVKTYRAQRGQIRRPIYCSYDRRNERDWNDNSRDNSSDNSHWPRWWPRRYLCGSVLEPIYGPSFGRECKITKRVIMGVPLVRISQ